MTRKKDPNAAPKAARKARAPKVPAVVAAAHAEAEANGGVVSGFVEAIQQVDKAKAGAVAVSSHYHEPYKADAWDVSYALHGEQVVDGNFRSEEAAHEHAARIREAYGLK